jgi:hypothetical protein
MKTSYPARDGDLLRFAIEILDELSNNGVCGDHGYIFADKYFKGLERSSDPPQPSEGQFVIWMSDGTGKGDDGDVLVASTAGGVTKYGTLFDHSGGGAW